MEMSVTWHLLSFVLVQPQHLWHGNCLSHGSCHMAIVCHVEIVCHMAFVRHAGFARQTQCVRRKDIQHLRSLTRQDRTCETLLAAKPYVYADADVPGQCILSKQSASCGDVGCCCRLVPPASILLPTHLRTQMDTPGCPSMPLSVKGK